MKAPFTCPDCGLRFKYCPKCKSGRRVSDNKRTSQFAKDASTPSGFADYCKLCEKKMRDSAKAAKEKP